MIEKILTCADHNFITSEPRRMRAHMLTSHPGELEAVRLSAGVAVRASAGVSEKGAASQPSKIDWRDVMKRYLDIVLEAEGVRFLHKDDWSNEEWTAIQTLSEES